MFIFTADEFSLSLFLSDSFSCLFSWLSGSVSDFSSESSSSPCSCCSPSFSCSACRRLSSSFSSFKRAISSLSSFSDVVSGSSVLHAVRINDSDISNKYFFIHFSPSIYCIYYHYKIDEYLLSDYFKIGLNKLNILS